VPAHPSASVVAVPAKWLEARAAAGASARSLVRAWLKFVVCIVPKGVFWEKTESRSSTVFGCGFATPWNLEA